jgi:hypothetical protein
MTEKERRVTEKERRVMEKRKEREKRRKQSRCPFLLLFSVVSFSFIIMNYCIVLINKVKVLVLTLSDTYFNFLLTLFIKILAEVQGMFSRSLELMIF